MNPNVRACILYQYPLQNNGNIYRLLKTLSAHAIPTDVYYADEPGTSSSINFPHVRIIPVKKNQSPFNYFIKHAAFIHYHCSLAKAALHSGIPYTHIISVDLSTLGAGAWLKKKLTALLIYYSLEINTETINQYYPQQAPFPKNLVFSSLIRWQRKYGEIFEARYLKVVDFFFTVNESLCTYFKEKYHYPHPIHIIMNCPELHDEKPVAVDYRQMFGWRADDKIFIYQGLLNAGRALKQIIDAMTLVPDYIKMVIVGYGPLEEELKKQVTEKKLNDRIKFLGAIGYDKLPAYTAGADFGIVYGEWLNISKFMGSPNKLFEYMHAGLPVLLWDTPESRRVLNKYPIGIFSQNDASSIAEGMKQLTGSSRIEEFKLNCEKGKQEYNWEKQVTYLLKVITSQ